MPTPIKNQIDQNLMQQANPSDSAAAAAETSHGVIYDTDTQNWLAYFIYEINGERRLQRVGHFDDKFTAKKTRDLHIHAFLKKNPDLLGTIPLNFADQAEEQLLATTPEGQQQTSELFSEGRQYTGISWSSKYQKFLAYMFVNEDGIKKRKQIGAYAGRVEAAIQRDLEILKISKQDPSKTDSKLNFPGYDKETLLAELFKQLDSTSGKLGPQKNTQKSSMFIGVSYRKSRTHNKWLAGHSVNENGKSRYHYIGYFATELEAAQARNASILAFSAQNPVTVAGIKLNDIDAILKVNGMQPAQDSTQDTNNSAAKVGSSSSAAAALPRPDSTPELLAIGDGMPRLVMDTPTPPTGAFSTPSQSPSISDSYNQYVHMTMVADSFIPRKPADFAQHVNAKTGALMPSSVLYAYARAVGQSFSGSSSAFAPWGTFNNDNKETPDAAGPKRQKLG